MTATETAAPPGERSSALRTGRVVALLASNARSAAKASAAHTSRPPSQALVAATGDLSSE